MLISLLGLVFTFLFPDPQTPNFYPGLTSAREASKKSQKEIVVFFSDKTCNTCEAAWVAFTKDIKATNHYVSTRMNKSDFDGGIFFDLMNLNEVPSWIILNPDGTEKERWSGGWKDASGNPTAFDQTTSISKTEVAKPIASKTEIAKATTSSTQVSVPTQPVAKNNPPSSEIRSNPGTVNTELKSGYVIQAGYFGSEANAQKMLGDLKAKGFSSFEINEEQKEGATFYRIISKKYAEEAAANVEQQKMNAAGIKVSVKKM